MEQSMQIILSHCVIVETRMVKYSINMAGIAINLIVIIAKIKLALLGNQSPIINPRKHPQLVNLIVTILARYPVTVVMAL